MKTPHVLIIGCGDLGTRLGWRLLSLEWQVTGFCRRPERLPKPFKGVRGDYTDRRDVAALLDLRPDYIVFTPLPTSREPAGYACGYADATALLAESGLLGQSKGGVFVSSTRVYAETEGGWVDEDSRLTDSDPSAASIIEAERVFQENCQAATVLRASGIYGDWPGMFVQRLMQGLASPAPDRISNRIHREDLASVMAFCLTRLESGLPNSPVYIASDRAPTPVGEIEAWLAQRLDLPLVTGSATSRRSNRKCSSDRLCSAGFSFAYPDYRAGFSELIDRQVGAGEGEVGEP